MKISIGSDHRGYKLKNVLIDRLQEVTLEAIEWSDVGAHDEERSDYPIFAQKSCEEILDGKAKFGILICGSGVGMAIAANRFKGIYAALCWSPEVARVAYEDDGVNVLVLASDFTNEDDALDIACEMIGAWARGAFKGGRYKKRLEMIDSV